MRETLSQRQLGSTRPQTHLSSETAATACFIFVCYAFLRADSGHGSTGESVRLLSYLELIRHIHKLLRFSQPQFPHLKYDSGSSCSDGKPCMR